MNGLLPTVRKSSKEFRNNGNDFDYLLWGRNWCCLCCLKELSRAIGTEIAIKLGDMKHNSDQEGPIATLKYNP